MVQIENILVVFQYKTIFKWNFLEMRIEFHNKVGSRGCNVLPELETGYFRPSVNELGEKYKACVYMYRTCICICVCIVFCSGGKI